MLGKDEIKTKLCEDEKHFSHVEYFLGLDDTEIIYAEEDGLLLKNSYIYTIYGANADSAERILRLIPPETDLITASNEDEVRAAKKVFPRLKCARPCYQVRYDDLPPAAVPEGFEIRVLAPTKENIDFVYSTYTLAYSREGVERVMKEYDFLAAYHGEEIAGYIGRHEEGSLGLLEIMPKYRKRGLGTLLVTEMAERVKKSGQTAYAHIICDNQKSLNMHLKMGVTPAKGLIYWIYEED